MVWLVNMADTDRPTRNSTEAASPQQEAQEGEQGVGVSKWLNKVHSDGYLFKQRTWSLLVWLLSLLCSRVIADSLQSVTGRWRVHPILDRPAAAPAGDTPVNRTEQARDPGDALRSSSCWRRRWGEWVMRADCFTFSSQRCCIKNSGRCIF